MGRSPRLVLSCIVVSATALLCLPATSPVAVAEPGPCEDLIVLEGDAGAGAWCTHGGDHVHDDGGHEHGEPDAVGAPRALVNAPPAPCPGNGAGGRRIVVYYGFPADTENRAAEFRDQIRTAVSLADANLDAATAGVDGQHYRFFCENDRTVTVRALKLLPIGGDGSFTFADLMSSLHSRVATGLGPEDLDKPKHIYSVFVDNVGGAYPYGGQGTMATDDAPDPSSNWNNVVTPGWSRYSMVRLGWTTMTIAEVWQHEIGHNLGAVQDSAPHSSLAGHCYEDLDVMCYADGGPYFDGGGAMVPTCTAMPDGQLPWDCGADDYYALDPAPDSYLAEHWNLIDSGWLSWSV